MDATPLPHRHPHLPVQDLLLVAKAKAGCAGLGRDRHCDAVRSCVPASRHTRAWLSLRGAVEWRTSRVLCLGLDGAGKTTLLCAAAAEQPGLHDVSPTTGFHVRTVTVKPDRKIDVWDIGGAAAIRPFWSRYVTRDTAALIWVVDAHDAARIGESQEALRVLLERQQFLAVLPLLVLLAKSDLTPDGGLDASHQFELPPSAVDRPRHVRAVSATSARGLEESLRWLASELAAREV